MEIEVLREDSEGFEVKVGGEDHTFLNLLTTFLQGNEKVEYAAYKVDHPLVSEPRLFFKLKDLSAEEDVPVESIKGVGPKTRELLHGIGIKTVSQLLLQNPAKLAEETGIAEKLIERYVEEGRKMVPKDKFGYRAVLRESLSELGRSFEEIKKGFMK